jgi:hypothetical protein
MAVLVSTIRTETVTFESELTSLTFCNSGGSVLYRLQSVRLGPSFEMTGPRLIFDCEQSGAPENCTIKVGRAVPDSGSSRFHCLALFRV